MWSNQIVEQEFRKAFLFLGTVICISLFVGYWIGEEQGRINACKLRQMSYEYGNCIVKAK